MKSVFSAFKGRKSDSGVGGASSGSNQSTIATKSGHGKSPINYENSYASLRQIRAADPFTKMSIASDDDLIDTCIRVTATPTKIDTASIPDGFEQRPALPAVNAANANGPNPAAASVSGHSSPANGSSSPASSASAQMDALQARLGSGLIGDVVTSLPPAKPVNVDGGDADCVRVPVLSASDNNRLLKSGDLNTLRNSKSSSNRLGKRLSLSGIGNNLLPTVHGRAKTGTTGTTATGTNGTEKTKTRFSHQRNLSLDFR